MFKVLSVLEVDYGYPRMREFHNSLPQFRDQQPKFHWICYRSSEVLAFLPIHRTKMQILCLEKQVMLLPKST